MATSPETDALLIRQLTQGDQGALSTLFERYAARALAVAQRVLSDPAEAEDVVQDVFVGLWKQPDRYDPARGSLAAWLARWTRNRAVDLRRRRGAHERAAQRSAARSDKFAVPPSRPDSGLGTALHKLPEEQRRVLELSFYEGLTQSEIAARLELPLGTIKSRMRLGLAKLREIYQEPQ